MADKNYIKVDGNGNIILQGISGKDININQISEIKEALRKANKETIEAFKAELDRRFEELIKINELAANILKEFVNNIQISNSKNINTGTFSNINGDITFGDRNYSFRGNTIEVKGGIKINEGGISIKTLKELLKDDSFLEKYNFLDPENPIFKQFLFLDRIVSSYMVNNFDEENKQIFFIKTYNKHQPDWLFHRFFLEIKNEIIKRNFQAYTFSFGEDISFASFKRALANRFNIKKDELSVNSILDEINTESTPVFHFSFDINAETKESKEFENKFYDFWIKSPKPNRKCITFVSIKIRKKSNWFSSVLKKDNNKFATSGEVFFKDELQLINQKDVERFLEVKLKNINPKITLKKSLEIQYLWSALMPEIYHSLSLENNH